MALVGPMAEWYFLFFYNHFLTSATAVSVGSVGAQRARTIPEKPLSGSEERRLIF